jgi:hypothetical protein
VQSDKAIVLSGCRRRAPCWTRHAHVGSAGVGFRRACGRAGRRAHWRLPFGGGGLGEPPTLALRSEAGLPGGGAGDLPGGEPRCTGRLGNGFALCPAPNPSESAVTRRCVHRKPPYETDLLRGTLRARDRPRAGGADSRAVRLRRRACAAERAQARPGYVRAQSVAPRPGGWMLLRGGAGRRKSTAASPVYTTPAGG